MQPCVTAKQQAVISVANLDGTTLPCTVFSSRRSVAEGLEKHCRLIPALPVCPPVTLILPRPLSPSSPPLSPLGRDDAQQVRGYDISYAATATCDGRLPPLVRVGLQQSVNRLATRLPLFSSPGKRQDTPTSNVYSPGGRPEGVCRHTRGSLWRCSAKPTQ